MATKQGGFQSQSSHTISVTDEKGASMNARDSEISTVVSIVLTNKGQVKVGSTVFSSTNYESPSLRFARSLSGSSAY